MSTTFLLTYLRNIENKVIPVNEDFPTGLNGVEIASHITRKKTVPFLDIVKHIEKENARIEAENNKMSMRR